MIYHYFVEKNQYYMSYLCGPRQFLFTQKLHCNSTHKYLNIMHTFPGNVHSGTLV